MEVLGKENLLVEMLCRNVLKLSDLLAAVILMGDVGARVTMYYMELELRIREKWGREMRPALFGWTISKTMDLVSSMISIVLVKPQDKSGL
jgi:hypothetical protein